MKYRFLSLIFTALLLLDSDAPGAVRADFGASILASLIVAVVIIGLTELLRPKPDLEDARPAGLGDFQFPTATEGRAIPLLWGTVRLKGPNVVWYGDLFQRAVTESIKTGLWSRTRITKAFRYHVGVQMALCRGPGCVLKKVWIGDDEVFSGTVTNEQTFDIDEIDLFGGDDLGNGGIQATCDFFAGENPQSQSTYLAGNTDRQLISSAATPAAPAYHGTCYVLARELTSAAATASDKGAYFGNSTTIKPWSFEVQRMPPLFAGQSAGDNTVNTDDANPVNVIYEILTNSEWGFGFNDADIDLAAFKTAADTVKTEGNGFSFVLTRSTAGTELLGEIERQIDGSVQLDVATGLWTIVLARADYNINTVPQVTEDNVVEIRDFTRGTWEETTNVIQVQYNKRVDDYKESFAVAQDMGNALILGGGTVSSFKPATAQMAFPGVKNEALAVNLAWRELRQKTYPLARVSLTLTREFWDLKIGDVIAWTDSTLGFTKLPLRVGRVDLGRVDQNEVRVDCIQDVFTFQAASFGTPVGTGWSPPTVDLVAFPSTEQLVFETPRAIVVKDPFYGGDPNISTVFASARRQSIELGFDINQRNASGTPSGSYSLAGEVLQFALIGELTNALDDGTAVPTAEIAVTGDPDSRFTIEAEFDDNATLTDLGQDLVHLCYVDGEFMLVSSASIDGSNVDLENVYRGVLDSVQKQHSAGTKVWMLFVGSGVTDTIFPQGNNVDIELRPFSVTETFSGSVTGVSLTMNKRTWRPYPPGAITWDGTQYGAMNVEANGAALNGYNIDFSFTRRNFEATDEIATKIADDSSVDASTEYRTRFFWDGTEVTSSLFSTTSPIDWTSSVPTVNIERRYLINQADIDSEFRIEVQTRHDYNGDTDLEALQTLTHRVTPTSEYNGLTYLGGSATTLPNSHTAASSGTYTVNIGEAYISADVEYRLNAGTWTTLIAAGGTTGNITGVTASDTIELRITENQGPRANEVEIVFSGSPVAYGCFDGTVIGSPDTVTGLVGWWDPSDSATITTSGGDVTDMTNKASGASAASDFAGDSPDPSQGTINSLDALSFFTGEAMSHDDAAAETNFGTGSFTISIVIETSQTIRGVLWGKGDTTGPRVRIDINASSSGDAFVFVDDDTNTVNITDGSGINDGSPHMITMWVDRTNDIMRLYVDGVQQGSDADISSVTGTLSASGGDADRQLLGAATAGATAVQNGYNGLMGEVLVYDNALSSSDLTTIHDYLSSKWGI